MKRVKILRLEEKSNNIYDKINEIETRLENLSTRRKKEQKSILEKYIDTYDGFVVNYFSDKVSVYVKDGNYSLLDMYVYDEWKSDSRSYNRIDFSTASFRTEFRTGLDMKWAAERFQLLAFYSKALADHMDDILAEFNNVVEKYSKLSEALYESKRPLNKEVREVNEIISRLKEEEMMEKLMSDNGLMIQPEKEDDYLPRFQVKFDWELSSVKSIRGVKKSASGKSVDLQVSVRRGYGDDKRLEVIDVDRVRFDNVVAFIRRNENQIV
tara:strand:- start:667 stop:1470 length:804 start_codon:yes stop_codon:yes gene_type:complete